MGMVSLEKTKEIIPYRGAAPGRQIAVCSGFQGGWGPTANRYNQPPRISPMIFANDSMSRARSFWPYPRIIAHRGGGVLAPENTLAGLELARNLGFEAVEFDVKLTEDGTPILMHDDTLDRTTDGHGLASEQAYLEIAELEAGAWFGNEFIGEPVPAFAAAAALCQQAGLWANVEIKPCPGRERETGEVVARMAKLLW